MIKKILYIVISIMVIGSPIGCFAEGSTFVYNNGEYHEYNEINDGKYPFDATKTSAQKNSFTYYCIRLGYTSNEVFAKHYDWGIIGFDLFTHKPLLVFGYYPDRTIDITKISKLASNCDFDESDVFSILDNGIKEKNITQKRIEASLSLKAVNGTIIDKDNNIKYVFENGYLVKYESGDGYGKWAKYLRKNAPHIFSKIENNALVYKIDSDKKKYINEQCEYFAKTNMSYLKQAVQFNYNYFLLYCVLYKPNITLVEFLFLVPEAQIYSTARNYLIVKVGLNVFTFKDNILI